MVKTKEDTKDMYLLMYVVVVFRDDNRAGRGRVSLSRTHPRKKNHPHPHTQIQWVSNFCPIPTG